MLINLRNALMAGKRTPTAKDYVPTGLVAMWDGIENAGWGVHDGSATTWVDLVGGVVLQQPLSTKVTWADDCCIFKSGTFFNNRNINSIKQCIDNESWSVEVTTAITSLSSTNASAFGFGPPDSRALWVYQNANTAISASGFNQYVISGIGEGNLGSVNHITATSDGRVYLNGTIYGTMTQGATVSAREGHLSLGKLPDFGGDYMVGNHYGARFYSRALTAAEIAANYAIDKARFGLP